MLPWGLSALRTSSLSYRSDFEVRAVPDADRRSIDPGADFGILPFHDTRAVFQSSTFQAFTQASACRRDEAHLCGSASTLSVVEADMLFVGRRTCRSHRTCGGPRSPPTPSP